MTETPAKYAAAKAPATSSRPVWPCRGMWRVIRTAGIRRGGGLSIACSLLHVRPSLTDAELDWPLRTANCTGFPVVLGFSRPSRCRARIGSASSAPSRPLTGFLAALATTRSERVLDHCPPVPRDTGRGRTVGIARRSRHAADPGAICAARSTRVWRAPPRPERRLAIVARVAAGAIPARRLRPGHQRSSRSEAAPARPVTARHEAPQEGWTVSLSGPSVRYRSG